MPRVPDILKLSWPEPKAGWEVGVLFEDADMLVLNKPARLLTSPDRYDPNRPNLMAMLHRDIARGAAWAARRGINYLANVHRLDFETTGILLLARTKDALRNLADQFGSGKTLKRYDALVHGGPEESMFEVDAPLAPHPRRLGIMRVDRQGGKRSRTCFELVETFRGYSLLTCRPHTGRTHQIRVHLRHAGLPIVGDVAYGGKPLLLSQIKRGYRVGRTGVERPLIGTVALHAAELTVQHPVESSPVTFVAPRPKDLVVALKYLGRFASASGDHPDEPRVD
jgi:23S rRNA pseudouridine1911/1915/1917 synthase